MVEFLIFFHLRCRQASRREGDQFQLIFQKICVKKSIYLVPTLSEIFLLKFVWYPPCQKFLDTRPVTPRFSYLCSNIKEVVGLEVGDIPWQDKRLFFLLGKVRCQNCKFSRPCHLPPIKIRKNSAAEPFAR